MMGQQYNAAPLVKVWRFSTAPVGRPHSLSALEICLIGDCGCAGGLWDERWVVDGVPRAAGVNSGRLDMYYISPDGKRMRSMSEVYQFLGLTSQAPKSSRPVPMPQAVDAPRSSREAKIYATAAISGAPPSPGFPSCQGQAEGM